MVPITFISTYKPIVCGIADYTEFIVREGPKDKWSVLSFIPENIDVSLRYCREYHNSVVRYEIPSYEKYSANHILEGLQTNEEQVLWFQHEFGIWRNILPRIRKIRKSLS